LDTARSAIEILPEVMDALEKIGAKDKIEVYIGTRVYLSNYY
jgi:hypothetical protein